MSDLVLARAFVSRHPIEAAAALDGVEPAEAATLLAGVPVESAAAVLGLMASAPAAACLASMPPEQAAGVVARVPPDALAVLLRRMAPAGADAVIDALPPRPAAVLRAGLAFPARSAGAIMDPRAPTLTPDLTVAEAVGRLRAEAADVDDEIYVVDRDQGLAGVVPARVLLVSDGALSVEDAMRPAAGRVPPRTAAAIVHAHPAWAHARALPVVAEDGRFLGVVGYDVVTRVAREGSAGRLAETSIGTLTSFSELCYVGSMELIASLVSMVDAQVGRLAAGDRA